MMNACVRVCTVRGAITRNNGASRQNESIYGDERSERALARQVPNEVFLYFSMSISFSFENSIREAARERAKISPCAAAPPSIKYR